jgi:RES domain-containing protein
LAPPDDSPTSKFSGIVYRVVQRGVDPLSTLGSGRNGGRYNSPGEEGTLYTSLDKETGIDEVAKGLRARGVDPKDYGPEDWWLYELETSLDAILDLNDANVLNRFQINSADLLQDDVTVTRRIGKQALEEGYQGILAPSAARPGEKNLVIFLRKVPQFPSARSSMPIGFKDR